MRSGLRGILLWGRGRAEGWRPGLNELRLRGMLLGLRGLLDALRWPVWLGRAGVHLFVLLGGGGEELRLLVGLLRRKERLADGKVMSGRLRRAERRAR